MVKRSSVGIGTVLKNMRRVGPHPWIGRKLAALEFDKRFFNLFSRTRHNGQAGKIRQVSFRLTDACNLRCHTCGQWGDNGYLLGQSMKQMRDREVSPGRYRELMKDLVAHGHRPLVYYWGGEPMLYRGILDLIAGASALGLPSSIATNGSHVAEAAQQLVEAPLFLLQVSIDGHCAGLHNRLRPGAGHGDNFGDIVRGLEKVREARDRRGRGLPVIASLTTISEGNLRHLGDIYDAFRDKVDLFVFYLSWWIDKESAAAHEQDFLRRFGFVPTRHRSWNGDWKSADHDGLDRQIEGLLAKSRSWSAPPVSILPPITGRANLKTYYTDHRATFGYNQCISIYQVVEVNSNGDVSPCRDYHDYVVGNVKNTTITDLWNTDAYRKFRCSVSRDGLMPVCTRCCGLMGY
jgi:radical SAM protein with 4Fe4S-binding SPASM domain